MGGGQRKVFALLKRSGALAGLGSAVGETSPDGSETKRKNRRTLSWQKGRGFKFVVFSTTNLNLLFRQTFLVFCVWLKTMRWQGPYPYFFKIPENYPGNPAAGYCSWILISIISSYPNYHSLFFFSPLYLPRSTVNLVKKDEIIYVSCWIKKKSTIFFFVFIYHRNVR